MASVAETVAGTLPTREELDELARQAWIEAGGIPTWVGRIPVLPEVELSQAQ